MAFGTLAHTFGKLPLRQLTQKIKSYDVDFVQLALSKAISDIDFATGRLSPGLANHVAEQFDKHGIRIGVLGCYINPIHPDPEQRRRELDRFKEHLRYARDFGASIVATETGSLDTFIAQAPDRYKEIGWSALKASVEELAETAEKWGVYAGIEPVSVHTLSSPEKMKQLLEEVPSPNIGVVFDPCNLFDQNNFAQRDQVVAQSFQLWGDRIILTHLKDAVYREDGRPKTVKPGTGQFDIPGFLKKLHRHKPFIDISIEDTKEEDINEVVGALRQIQSDL